MPLFENSLIELIDSVMRLGLGTIKKGTCTGGATGTFVDTSRREKDDYFQSTSPPSRVRIISTTDGLAPKGEEREVSDWVLSTWTGSVAPDFSVAPAAGDTYRIFTDPSWDDVQEAINRAIDLVAGKALIPWIDETTTIQAATYEYAIPDGFVYIHKITQSNGDGDFTVPIPPDQWVVKQGLAVPVIHLLQYPNWGEAEGHYVSTLWADSELDAAKVLRIEGLRRQPKLDTDDSVCYISPNFVINQAAAWLHAARIRRRDVENDEHAARYQVYQDIADSVRKAENFSAQHPPDSKRVM